MRQVLRSAVLTQQPVHVEQRLRMEAGTQSLENLLHRHRGDQNSTTASLSNTTLPGSDDRRMASSTWRLL
ncbi:MULTISPECIES: hypothetical protein [Streptomyces]|uniref:hypothetical protein n=1 Tax=Streptomyces TaxID=1883 RepID=UPI00131D6AA9|nr:MULTISPECIES: hypothetical protein [Streptomyces]